MCGGGGAALAGGTQAASSRGEPGGSADALRAGLLGLEAAAIRSPALAWWRKAGGRQRWVGPLPLRLSPTWRGWRGLGRGFPSPRA